jgi:hypothetical protein
VDGGFTSGPEDGVKRRRSQVKGQKPKGKGQNRGEEWKAEDGGRQAEQRWSHRRKDGGVKIEEGG